MKKIVLLIIFVCILFGAIYITKSEDGKLQNGNEKAVEEKSNEELAEECAYTYNEEEYKHDLSNSFEKPDAQTSNIPEKCMKRTGIVEKVYLVQPYNYEQITIESNEVGYLKAKNEDAVVYINDEKINVTTEKTEVNIKKGDNVNIQSSEPIYFYTGSNSIMGSEIIDSSLDSETLE